MENVTAYKNRRSKTLIERREYHTASSGIFFKAKRLLYRRSSPYQKIEVIDNEHFGKILILDGLIQTTEKDEFYYHEMLIHPALVCHPSPQSLLIIGGGDGGALKETLRYPVRSVCMVEIDCQVIDACRTFFPWLSSSLKDNRAELVIADGRKFIEETERKFDVVLIDSSDPVGPSVSLHERKFYKNLKRCLNPNGIVAAQVGSPFFYQESIEKKNSFLKKLFRFVRFYTGPIPTYPGGSWCYVFLADDVQPFQVKRIPPSGLKYFNLEIHRAAFSLPNFLKDLGSGS